MTLYSTTGSSRWSNPTKIDYPVFFAKEMQSWYVVQVGMIGRDLLPTI